MGILDGLLGKRTEAARQGLPFNVSTSLRPVRLSARKESSLELLITTTNVTDAPIMVSASVEVPRQLGFENVGMTKIKEIRMGELAPQKEKAISVSICSNPATPAGTYAVLVTVSHHYRDYSHVLNYAKKTVEVRVV